MSKEKLIKFINDNEISLGIASKKTKLKKSKNIGYGRFATEDILPNEIIYRAGGLWLTENERNGFDKDYFQLVENAWHFQGGLKFHLNGCHNHSCNPNAYCQEYVIRALRKIDKGEEITLDYAAFIYHNYIIIESCNCGSKDCRKSILGSDWKTYNLPKKYNYKVNGHILEMWLQDQQS
jgi:hypothetical protein